MKKRVAITGSNGFIGRHLLSLLKNPIYDIIEISREKDKNICEWESLQNLPKCDFVIHLAAKTYVPESFNEPRLFYETNFIATLNALELSKNWGASFIYVSSYLYGSPQYLPVDEMHPIHPHNPYAQTKLVSENLCEGYFRDFDIPITVFRLFNVYGPEQRGAFLIPEIINQMKTGKVVLRDSRPKRDYIHVNDVILALKAAVDKDLTGYNLFNLGSGISYSVKSLVEFIMKASKKSFEVKFTNEYRKGEVLDSVADIRVVKEVLGWSPTISLEDGIRDILK